MRASDADRDKAVLALREHTVAGRLTLEEFSERTERALAAQTVEELEPLQRDLPVAGQRRRPKRFTGVAFGRTQRPIGSGSRSAQSSRRSVEANRMSRSRRRVLSTRALELVVGVNPAPRIRASDLLRLLPPVPGRRARPRTSPEPLSARR